MLTEGSYWGFSGNTQVIKEPLVLLLSISSVPGALRWQQLLRAGSAPCLLSFTPLKSG